MAVILLEALAALLLLLSVLQDKFETVRCLSLSFFSLSHTLSSAF